MRIKTSELRRDNIGQVITLDTEEESVVSGTIEAIERRPDEILITVGSTVYEFNLNESVDIVRSTVLAHLIRDKPLTENILHDLLEDAVQPGSDFRLTLEELIREVVTDVVQIELTEAGN